MAQQKGLQAKDEQKLIFNPAAGTINDVMQTEQ